jgi:hypothetical protein
MYVSDSVIVLMNWYHKCCFPDVLHMYFVKDLMKPTLTSTDI